MGYLNGEMGDIPSQGIVERRRILRVSGSGGRLVEIKMFGEGAYVCKHLSWRK